MALASGDVQIIQSGSGISHNEQVAKDTRAFRVWFDPGYHAALCRNPRCALALAVCALVHSIARLGAQAAPASNAVVAGELMVDPPTLINLGFEWPIEGDADVAAVAAERRADQVGQDDRGHRAQHVCGQHSRSRAGQPDAKKGSDPEDQL